MDLHDQREIDFFKIFTVDCVLFKKMVQKKRFALILKIKKIFFIPSEN